ncbi:CaiB/BaiF CoA transferase family protein [Saccharopolyspora spinosa]|nr:CaiB/BaiF CoA-transferase family protein [Saccharopolyspora spinosa]
MSGALSGIRVLDLSRVLAGPYCTQMLADHGAEVLKVEPPNGDETRAWGPPFIRPGTSAYYQALNRNKRNIVLDLRIAGSQGVLRRLLSTADVLVENFKAGTLEKWGFADERLAEDFPRLVHCRITGYGTDGPLGGAPGYDAVLQAYSGLLSVNGEAERDPLRVGVPVVDLVTGILSFSGVLLALQERAASGRGQVVDCSLLDTGISLLHPHSASWFADGRGPQRTGSAHPTIAPYDTFPAYDGLLFLGVGNDRQFRDLTDVLGDPCIAEDPRFASNSERVQHRDALRELLVPRISLWKRADLADALQKRGVPSSPVHSVGEALTNAQVLHREMVVSKDDYRGAGIPIKLSRTPGSVHLAPRDQGQDTEAVLEELGYSDEEIAVMTGVRTRR